MKLIVITLPTYLENESTLIEQMLELGIDKVHIRKPSWSCEKVRELILSIDKKYRERLILHDFFELCEELSLGGVQINGRNPGVPAFFCKSVSSSCHSIDEVESTLATFDKGNLSGYVTLSPIFNSISKSGYSANFSEQQLREASVNGVINRSVVAMGGVTPNEFAYLSSLGFGGVALLGYIWGDGKETRAKDVAIDAAAEAEDSILSRVAYAIKMAKLVSNFSLQFITHRNATLNDLSGAKEALNGGCRWVQLRMKGFSDEEFILNAAAIREECREVGATFLLNDKVHLVKQCKADGVHIGKNDMPPREARAILGDGAIIGGTANTIDDIDYLVEQGVDYIGLGPFKFTSTKDNLSPILGLEGYKNAIEHCKSRGYSTPIVAIGGITESDITPIMGSGVDGIALSGSILNADNSELCTKNIVEIIARCGNKKI